MTPGISKMGCMFGECPEHCGSGGEVGGECRELVTGHTEMASLKLPPMVSQDGI